MTQRTGRGGCFSTDSPTTTPIIGGFFQIPFFGRQWVERFCGKQAVEERRLLDTAAGGCEVVICLIVRRFRCLAPDCPKATFAEQVDGLTSRHARRTPAVTAVLQAVALALGGRAGARLSGSAGRR